MCVCVPVKSALSSEVCVVEVILRQMKAMRAVKGGRSKRRGEESKRTGKGK